MTTHITVAIGPNDADLARSWADSIHATDTMKRPNYTGLHAPNRFLLGYLGEIACATWLRALEAEFTHHVRTDGHPGEPELTVLGPKGYFTIDPKFGHGVKARRFMFPEAQYQQVNLYIGGRVLNPESRVPVAEIHGWLTFKEAHELPVADFGYGVPTRWCYLSELHDMAPLAEAVKSRRKP